MEDDGIAHGAEGILFALGLSFEVEALIFVVAVVELDEFIEVVIVLLFLVDKFGDLIFGFYFF